MSAWWVEYPNGRHLIEAPDVDSADEAAMRRWGTYPSAVYEHTEGSTA